MPSKFCISWFDLFTIFDGVFTLKLKVDDWNIPNINSTAILNTLKYTERGNRVARRVTGNKFTILSLILDIWYSCGELIQ